MLTTPQHARAGPFVADVPASREAATVQERRTSGRIRAKLAVEMIGMGEAGTVRCTVTDIGAGGLYAQAPVELGLVVGRRYELAFSAEDAEASELARFVGEGCYATVVRTTQKRSNEGARLVGAGLRFDQPLVFWEMPPKNGP